MEVIKFCCDSINMPKDTMFSIESNILKCIFKEQIICLKFVFTGEITKILSACDNIIENHLLRLLKCKFEVTSYRIDEIYDIMSYIFEIISDIHSYCTICSKKLTIEYYKPSCCGDLCYATSLGIWTDNCVTNLYNDDSILFNTLLEMSISCVIGPNRENVFSPFPPQFIDKNGNKKYGEIDKLIPEKWKKMDFLDLKEKFKIADNDRDIIDYLKPELYSFVKFSILSNKTRLKTETIGLDTKGILFFEVVHDLIKKEKFDNQDPEYLFHGSGINNWYSILRNGLKNYSGTKNMINGAAYGNGIYLSDNSALSFGYSSRTGAGKLILGVVQINGTKDKFYKNGNIFVVPNEEDVLLKYLIVLNHSTAALTSIQDYFMKSRVQEIKGSQKRMIDLTIKRIIKEFSEINSKVEKFPDQFRFKIDSTEHHNKVVWRLEFKNKILIDIIFTTGYPVDPPIAMIYKPQIIVKESKYVFSNGIIMLDKLLPKVWSPKTRMMKIIIDMQEIIEKLDFTIVNTNSEYDYTNVLSEYSEVVKKLIY